MEKVNIVKIGSDSLNESNLTCIIKDALSWEKEFWEKFLFVSSGAVKMWKKRVKEIQWSDKSFEKSVLAAIGQQFLMQMYDRISWVRKLVWEILIDDFANEEYLAKSLSNMIKNDVWPVVNYNDCLHWGELMNVSNKTDNDKNTVFLSKIFQTHLATKVRIERIIYLTNTAWLLDNNNKTVTWWKVIFEEDKGYYRGFVKKLAQSESWTWGMWSKIECWLEVLDYGVKESIISHAESWLSCLKFKNKCTTFYY